METAKTEDRTAPPQQQQGHIPPWLKQQAMFFRLPSAPTGGYNGLEDDDSFLTSGATTTTTAPPSLAPPAAKHKPAADNAAAATAANATKRPGAGGSTPTSRFARCNANALSSTPVGKAAPAPVAGKPKPTTQADQRASLTDVAINRRADDHRSFHRSTEVQALSHSPAMPFRAPPLRTTPPPKGAAATTAQLIKLDYTPDDVECFRLSDRSRSAGTNSTEDDEAFLTGRLPFGCSPTPLHIKVSTASSALPDGTSGILTTPVAAPTVLEQEEPSAAKQSAQLGEGVDTVAVGATAEEPVQQAAAVEAPASPVARPSATAVVQLFSTPPKASPHPLDPRRGNTTPDTAAAAPQDEEVILCSPAVVVQQTPAEGLASAHEEEDIASPDFYPDETPVRRRLDDPRPFPLATCPYATSMELACESEARPSGQALHGLMTSGANEPFASPQGPATTVVEDLTADPAVTAEEVSPADSAKVDSAAVHDAGVNDQTASRADLGTPSTDDAVNAATAASTVKDEAASDAPPPVPPPSAQVDESSNAAAQGEISQQTHEDTVAPPQATQPKQLQPHPSPEPAAAEPPARKTSDGGCCLVM